MVKKHEKPAAAAAGGGVFAKIHAVMRDAKHVKLDTEAQFGAKKTRVASIESVIETYKPHMIRNGLLVLPVRSEFVTNERREYTNKYGDPKSERILVGIYHAVAVDVDSGERYEFSVVDGSNDESNFGAGKWNAYGLKYALLQLFLGERGEDPDVAGNPDPAPPPPQQQQKRQAAPEKPKAAAKEQKPAPAAKPPQEPAPKPQEAPAAKPETAAAPAAPAPDAADEEAKRKIRRALYEQGKAAIVAAYPLEAVAAGGAVPGFEKAYRPATAAIIDKVRDADVRKHLTDFALFHWLGLYCTGVPADEIDKATKLIEKKKNAGSLPEANYKILLGMIAQRSKAAEEPAAATE
jgi:hypothetical protein